MTLATCKQVTRWNKCLENIAEVTSVEGRLLVCQAKATRRRLVHIFGLTRPSITTPCTMKHENRSQCITVNTVMGSRIRMADEAWQRKALGCPCRRKASGKLLRCTVGPLGAGRSQQEVAGMRGGVGLEAQGCPPGQMQTFQERFPQARWEGRYLCCTQCCHQCRYLPLAR